MSELNPRELELVALGAAMGSNCVPCVEYHIPASRKAGLSDAEIHAAILHADRIRQVPARKTLQAALKLLPAAAGDAGSAGAAEGCGCEAVAQTMAETGKTGLPRDAMMTMMSKMMNSCGSRGQTAAASDSAEMRSDVSPATRGGCGCG
jgi:4-carboxymuconolactone decarboxylase